MVAAASSAEIRLSCHIPAPAERVWAEACRPNLVRHVAWPLLVFRPIDPPNWPEVFTARVHTVSVRLLGCVPMGRQVIDISFPEAPPGLRRFRDNGHGTLARRWDHVVEVAPENGGCRYTDCVTVDAGRLTPVVTAFARLFLAHRQRRWRRLAESGFSY